MELIYPEESNILQRIAIQLHRELGCGFKEKVYQDAFELELKEAGIPYKREQRIQILYKGKPLNSEYIADFICYDKIIVELKAVSELTDVHFAQVLNYLTATNLDLGLLVNFGEKSLHVERIFNYRKNQINQNNP
jgi:GxxExxY protein